MFGWVFVFHVLGTIFWIAGLLLATKVLALHSQPENADSKAVLGRLQRTLLLGWGLPGMAVVAVSGVMMIMNNPAYYMRAGWLHAKLFLVIALAALHGWMVLRGRAVVEGRSKMSRGLSGALHGGIALVVLAILALVFNKP